MLISLDLPPQLLPLCLCASQDVAFPGPLGRMMSPVYPGGMSLKPFHDSALELGGVPSLHVGLHMQAGQCALSASKASWAGCHCSPKHLCTGNIRSFLRSCHPSAFPSVAGEEL